MGIYVNDSGTWKLPSEVWINDAGTWKLPAVFINDAGTWKQVGGWHVYSASGDDTVRKIDPGSTEVWSFTGHTSTVYAVAVDSDGNVYSASVDDTVRKIDSDGNQVWSFTGHTSTVRGVAVDPGLFGAGFWL